MPPPPADGSTSTQTQNSPLFSFLSLKTQNTNNHRAIPHPIYRFDGASKCGLGDR
jgi:hypothetical protein